ncbi:MAG TPA: substrate-binding domain-containing protein [Kiritimatiellia bacterium]|nr:substrate-binding domain-containing protein [Kiritimatiellia bacterium]HRU70364.1 substrate-binding domain-containing protein [Kiritimatiellia bacterium]
MAHNKTPVVAVVYPASVPWMAECLRGIKKYADEQGGWRIVTSPPFLRSAGEEDIHLPALRSWPGDGVVACLTTRGEEKAAARLPMPVVNLSGWRPPGSGVPRVNADHAAIGLLAAEHLLALGLRHFGYYGIEGPWYSQVREQGFVERLKKAGRICAVYRQPVSKNRAQTWQERHAGLERWLVALPKPCGILAVHDYRARVVMELCSRLGIAIPEDVALLGVDNDPMTCEYCTPSLSSVSRDPFACGVAAAALLDRLMRGLPVSGRDTLVPPQGVVTRGSTDRFYDDDPVVRRVVAHVAAQEGGVLSITAIAKKLKISRRLIEMRFRERLGTTPHAYLQQRRVQYARNLLLDSAQMQSVGEIAAASGFGCARAFREAFRAVTGCTPKAFRERYAKGPC